MVSPPRIGFPQELTSTCAPPRTRHATARLTSDTPETMTSMNALMSHGTPMFGSTLESGVINAPARLASPAPSEKVMNRTNPLLMPSPRARFSFMMTARVTSPSRVPLSSKAIPNAMTTATRTRSNRYSE